MPTHEDVAEDLDETKGALKSFTDEELDQADRIEYPVSISERLSRIEADY